VVLEEHGEERDETLQVPLPGTAQRGNVRPHLSRPQEAVQQHLLDLLDALPLVDEQGDHLPGQALDLRTELARVVALAPVALRNGSLELEAQANSCEPIAPKKAS
jgi:hypothetical protein